MSFLEFFRNEFNGAWGGPIYHEIDDELTVPDAYGKKKKVYKQQKRILGIVAKYTAEGKDSYMTVPDDPGIYLLRDTYSNNICVGGPILYAGRTQDQGIKTRLSQHLNETGSKSLQRNIMYEIRWAEVSGGKRMTQIAEALAVLHFKPTGNIGKDWLGSLRRAFDDGLNAQILDEAERLGFLAGSQKERLRYMKSLLDAVGRGAGPERYL